MVFVLAGHGEAAGLGVGTEAVELGPGVLVGGRDAGVEREPHGAVLLGGERAANLICLQPLKRGVGLAAVRRKGRGGPRPGAGRPRGPSGEVRRNRVVVTLTDSELAKLERWAEERELPLGTVAYEIVGRALARRQ